MPDRERVKKALELCGEHDYCRSGCPYNGRNDCYNAMCRDALKLIRELEHGKSKPVRRVQTAQSGGIFTVKRQFAIGEPTEIIKVRGMNAARAAIRGCWHWSVVDEATGVRVL